MRISDWSSDVCSSDLRSRVDVASRSGHGRGLRREYVAQPGGDGHRARTAHACGSGVGPVERAAGGKGDPFGGAWSQSRHRWAEHPPDRTSVGKGKSVSGRLDLGGRRTMQKKNNTNQLEQPYTNHTKAK